MNYDRKTIGQRIKACRKEAGFKNQDDFGFALKNDGENGYDRKTISKWESGANVPQLDVLLDMCGLFNCELGYLLGEYDQKTRAATDIHQETGLDEAVIDKLRKMKAEADVRIDDGIPENLAFLSEYIHDFDAYYPITPDAAQERRLPLINALLLDIDRIIEAVNGIIRFEYERQRIKKESYSIQSASDAYEFVVDERDKDYYAYRLQKIIMVTIDRFIDEAIAASDVRKE